MNAGALTHSAAAIDPAALMRIGSLELRARVVVEGFFRGLHRNPAHGSSVEFTEYRAYSPGDDTRHIDWRLFARSDRLCVKKYEGETNLRCTLLVDHSRSMGFSSLDYTKAQYAATAAATLARFLMIQGDAVGLVTFDNAIDQYLPARNRPGHLRRLMHHLDRTPAGEATDLAAPLAHAARLLSRRGMIVLFSDLLAPIETLEHHLALLRAAGHDVVLFQVLDPAEKDFTFDGPALFRDMESGRDLLIDPAAAREAYHKRLEKHQQSVADICSRHGIDFHQLPTDRPLELALYDFLADRQRRRK